MPSRRRVWRDVVAWLRERAGLVGIAAFPLLLALPLAEKLWPGGHEPFTLRLRFGDAVPRLGWWAVVCAVLAFLLTRWIARRSLTGPIVIGGIVDTTTEDDGAARRSGDALVAVLADRLSRAGAQPRGVTPSGAAETATELTVNSALTGRGVIAKVSLDYVFRSVTRQGWTVQGTMRRADRSRQIGLTVTVTHNATREQQLARTVWGESAQDAARRAAYDIAAWYLGRLDPPSSRQRPAWQRTPASLRHYEDAVFFMSQRRFDEVIEAASAGLGEDPSNLPLRRLLGEAYERLGHFLTALQSYAAGMVLILDLDNSWNVSREETARLPWPPREGPVRSDDVTGILWRYVAVLTFADQWIDRWITDIARFEESQRTVRPDDASGGSRWRGTAAGDARTRAGLLARREREREREVRGEAARRLRGFFHQRYRELLREEFPLLRTTWFAEADERRAAFPPVTPDGPALAPAPSAGAWYEAEQERFSTVPSTPAGGAGDEREAVRAWARELDWFFRRLPGWVPAGAGPAVPLVRGEAPGTAADVVLEVATRLGLDAAAVPGALASPGGSDRLLVGEVVTWAASHLLRLPAGQVALGPGEADRLVRLRGQLDLRRFFQRAALEEVGRLHADRDVRLGRFAPPQLVRLLWLSCRYRYLDRLLTVAGPHAFGIRQAAIRRSLRALNAEAARDCASEYTARVESGPWRAWVTQQVTGRRGDPRRWAQWNVYYYTACVHAIALPSPADLEGAERAAWIKNGDSIAELAVRALSHALLVRDESDQSPTQEGVLDWLLYEDPDLENLRAHPRFSRWATSTFALPPLARRRDWVDGESRRRFEVLRRSQWANEGVYGKETRWRPVQRLWWSVNDHYLVTTLGQVVPDIVAGWRALAQAAGGGKAAGADWPQRFADRAALDDELWERLAGYGRFAARPDLRREAARGLARLAGHPMPQPGFPVTRDVLSTGVHLDYDDAWTHVAELVEESGRAAARARALLREAPLAPANGSPRLQQLAMDAAERWDRLRDTVVAASVAPAGDTAAAPGVPPRP